MKIVFVTTVEANVFSDLEEGDMFTDESGKVCAKASANNGCNCLCFMEDGGFMLYRQVHTEKVVFYPDATLVMGEKKTKMKP